MKKISDKQLQLAKQIMNETKLDESMTKYPDYTKAKDTLSKTDYEILAKKFSKKIPGLKTLKGKKYFYERKTGIIYESKSLVERFGVPPFDVLDTKQPYWKKREKLWDKIRPALEPLKCWCDYCNKDMIRKELPNSKLIAFECPECLKRRIFSKLYDVK